MKRVAEAEHGVINRLPGERLGYFGWPSIARVEDGTLLAVSSGLRMGHVCPFGKTVLNISHDEGRTWSAPRVIQDSMIDDRDAGVVDLGGGRLLVSFFRCDTRTFADWSSLPEDRRKAWRKTYAGFADVVAPWTDEQVTALLGSYVILSEDGGATWGDPIRVPVSAPHGPIMLRSGSLLYLGKVLGGGDAATKQVQAARSDDGGRSWTIAGIVPVSPGTDAADYHEPHALELPSGRLLGMIRYHGTLGPDRPNVGFNILQTESHDGGCTWAVPRRLGFHGSPPHLIRHSSGVLILSYGCRRPPYGQRLAFSHDDGMIWDHDWVLRDDSPDMDCGYPATAELADGSLITVYYQKAAPGEQCSLLYSRWRLPG